MSGSEGSSPDATEAAVDAVRVLEAAREEGRQEGAAEATRDAALAAVADRLAKVEQDQVALGAAIGTAAQAQDVLAQRVEAVEARQVETEAVTDVALEAAAEAAADEGGEEGAGEEGESGDAADAPEVEDDVIEPPPTQDEAGEIHKRRRHWVT